MIDLRTWIAKRVSWRRPEYPPQLDWSEVDGNDNQDASLSAPQEEGKTK